VLQTNTTISTRLGARRRRNSASAHLVARQFARACAATILRGLILLLLALLGVFIGLVLVTGRFEIGTPIIGGILFVGFGAAQFARPADD
jgi:hypothetical protein